MDSRSAAAAVGKPTLPGTQRKPTSLLNPAPPPRVLPGHRVAPGPLVYRKVSRKRPSFAKQQQARDL